ncbi:uncharacterized protein LOC123314653 [Coccinella septempunctata]|uniref:uncharacterized protein LOC123314653 n=1 Tax=Coccinella septempunctata TaxID=41139 RepID=UPI001D07893C|nr:uncharacterized protein LOC123314653 [Coccinella septempunctata]
MICTTVSSIKTICAMVLLMLGYAECQAKHRQDKRWVDKSILCYECNSEYDPRCGDPFDNYTIGIVNCSLKRQPEYIEFPPTLCRKTVQIVNGKTRVIRSCGYIVSDRDDRECAKRSGTHDVQLRYCSCTGSLCNHSYKLGPSSLIILFSAIALLGTNLLKLGNKF